MAPEATCKACEEPLVVEVEDEEENQSADPRTVPDDLELGCGCHFHWQCLLDQSSEVGIHLKCPSCDSLLAQNSAGPSSTNAFLLTTAGVSIITRYTNEGGVQDNLDILPAITEEAYLEANPEARPARAFQTMCGEGDIDGIVDLLRDVDQTEGDADTLSAANIIRYQDPLADMKSGLHLAVEQQKEEVVWLLLWIASTLRTDAFPQPLRMIAIAMGLERPNTSTTDDIRALQDTRGRTAETIAAENADAWTVILEGGVLQPGVS
ncbi:hypothetical protein GGR57DRAFT_227542 [Xylariaceae sp. FL1272]|nr:hypothetical protein GGR57DRAFT_227542 [Xylariaceae sp. FL1272]